MALKRSLDLEVVPNPSAASLRCLRSLACKPHDPLLLLDVGDSPGVKSSSATLREFHREGLTSRIHTPVFLSVLLARGVGSSVRPEVSVATSSRKAALERTGSAEDLEVGQEDGPDLSSRAEKPRCHMA